MSNANSERELLAIAADLSVRYGRPVEVYKLRDSWRGLDSDFFLEVLDALEESGAIAFLERPRFWAGQWLGLVEVSRAAELQLEACR